MCADSIKFQKIEKETTSGDDEFGCAMDSIRDDQRLGEDMAGTGYSFAQKTYTVTRKNIMIIGLVALIVVMTLFVISAVIGHYTAKQSQVKGYGSGSYQDWSPWNNWNPCSVTCDIGTKLRTRTCLLEEPYVCMGRMEETDICIMNECNDDKWTAWSKWSSCTNTTGACKKSRSRSCQNTALQIGGGRCSGNSTQEAVCNKKSCFGSFWTAWADWGDCSTHCDLGVKTRERLCKDHTGKNVSIERCPGESKQKEWCHNVDCKDADECLSNPCQHGTCVDQYKEYACVCEMGWKGKNCEVVDHCMSAPCVYGNCTSHAAGYNCTCIGSMGPRCEIPMADCVDIRDAGVTESGAYTIRLESTKEHVKVYCDMETDGGGWTVFQYRFNGSVEFYRNFSDYEFGFGNLNGEFWLGLHYIYHLTRGSTELRIDLAGADTSTAYETFQHFTISAAPYYTLDVSSSSGTISPSSKGLLYNDGEHFSTFDNDRSGNNCAEKDQGGWWFDNCAYANLNGHYGVPGSTTGYNGRQEAAMTYRSFKSYESLLSSKMMIRRK